MNVSQQDPDRNSYSHNGTAQEGLNERIKNVIEKRQSLARKVQPVYQHLETLHQAIGKLNQRSQMLRSTVTQTSILETLNTINFLQLSTDIGTERDRLKQLIDRISRPTLNIGVVGRMRQGKSTFLQRLSGLTNNEIPALKGGACTAVRSKIYHHNGETKAIVTLHSEQSFLAEVIAPYYDTLGLGTQPGSLDEFANTSFPNTLKGGAANQTMYDHLRIDYHHNLRQYRSSIQAGAPREIDINKEDIPAYVVQQRDTRNRLKTFTHLAVREVKIYCRFDQLEVTNLGLVDVPGMGDTRLGDSEIILETLGREVDAVLFFRRPDSMGFQWEQDDLDLYDLADKALPDLADRAFMILNHQRVDGDNLHACKALQEGLGKIAVVESAIVDCANPEEANQLLDRVLQYLDKQILKLEEQHAHSCQTNLLELHQRMQEELEKSRYVMRASTQENQLFRRLSKEFFQNLSNGLRELLIALEQEQSSIDTDFERVVQVALAACANDSGIPSEEEIINRTRGFDLHDSYGAAYCVLVPELRAHLSENFLALDNGLQQAANKLKERVAKVLIEKGELGGLTNAKGAAFLDAITEILAESGNPLELGFRTLATFNISYGSLVLRLIRQNLMSVLDPDEVARNHELAEAATRAVAVVGEIAATVGAKATMPISSEMITGVANAVNQLATATIDSKFEFNAKTVRENLQKLHQEAVEKCTQTLHNWLKAPSQIRYYMATEFVDRVLDAKDMEAEWDEFLREPGISAKVWEEFGQIEQLKHLQQSWLESVQQVLDLNQRKLLKFLD